MLSEKQSLHQMLQIESEKRNKKEGLQALGKDDIIRELNLKVCSASMTPTELQLDDRLRD